MEALISILVFLLALGIVGGVVLGWVGFFRNRNLTQRIANLERQLELANKGLGISAPEGTSTDTPAESLEDAISRTAPIEQSRTPVDSRRNEAAVFSEPPDFEFPEEMPNPVFEHLKSHWMIWLGGICVGLAGVFLVRYSIEQGLLGPTARIVVGIATGIVLHMAALWLQRRHGAQPAFAALAGGASLILYAVLLAAMQLYTLISPGMTFVLLAGVSLLTMLLSLRHGPILAMLGLLGGYVVPLLVSTGSSNIGGALVYSLVITASALLLMRYVFRPWLWIGMLVGAMAWWALSMLAMDADTVRGPYLAALVWLILALPALDLLLRRTESGTTAPWSIARLRIGGSLSTLDLMPALGLIAVAHSLSIAGTGLLPASALFWGPLTLLVLIAAARRDGLIWLPWLNLGLQLIAWLWVAGEESRWSSWPVQFAEERQRDFLQYAGWMAGLHVVVSAWQIRCRRNVAVWSSLLCLSPLLWLAICWLLTDASAFTWRWSLATVTLGLIYGGFAGRQLFADRRDGLTVWLILGAHAAYALAATMMFEQAGLTLVLATLIVSLALMIHRFSLPGLDYVLKGVIGLVVMRLTVNPWLIDYPVTSHWSLWSYGGATACCAFAAWRLRGHITLSRWLELATLHLLVLTIWAEVRYWLYDGDLFVARYGFTEAVINVNLLIALALIYHWRSGISTRLSRVYALGANVLLGLSLVNYGLLLTLFNPWWNTNLVGSAPLWNLLLPGYGLPVAGFLLIARFFPALHRRVVGPLAAIAAFVFVNLEIRHLWNGGFPDTGFTSDGELYTYSIVWLLIAVVVMLLARSREHVMAYRAGIGLLGPGHRKDFPGRHVGTGRITQGCLVYGTGTQSAGSRLAASAL